MQIQLIMEPGVSIGWEEFYRTKPPFSIALDGYVHGKSGHHVNKKGIWVNFDHHEGVYRIASRATCGQVYYAIQQGLLKNFKETINVFANDCDQDVCISWTLLNNSHIPGFMDKKIVYKLVMAEDTIDTFGGSYPFSRDFVPIMKKLAWIFEPYSNFRAQGRIIHPERDPEEFKQVVYAVERRFLASIAGKGKSLALDIRYKKFGGNNDWVVAEETGIHAKTGIFQDGYSVYALFRRNPFGKHFWVIGKLTYIPVDLKRMADTLNKLEGTPEEPAPFGGGDMIFGNRNSSGSLIGPEEMCCILSEAAERAKEKVDSQCSQT